MKILSLSDTKSVLMISLLVFIGYTLAPFSVVMAQKESVNWYSMQKAQALARKNNKKVLIFAQTSWCVYCKKMRDEVFPDPAVIDSINAYFYAVKIDIESNKSMIYNGKKVSEQQFARAHRVHATPTTFFFDTKGKILGGQPGFISSDTFSRLLGFIGSGSFQKMEFKTYLKQHPGH